MNARRIPIAHLPSIALLGLAVLLTPAAVGGIEVLTHGDRIDIRQHLDPGRAVLFDFYADWCGPCRSLSPELERLAREHSDRLTVRKVDIVRWGSPVAQQYALSGIPHLKLFGPDGNLVAEGYAGEVLGALERLLPTLSPSKPGPGGRPEVAVVTARPPVPFAVFLVGLVAVGGVVLVLAGVGRRSVRPAVVSTPGRAGGSGTGTDGGARRPPRPSPLPEDRGWFVFLAGVVEGPYTAAEMERMRRAGQLPAGTPIRHRNDPDWRTVGG